MPSHVLALTILKSLGFRNLLVGNQGNPRRKPRRAGTHCFLSTLFKPRIMPTRSGQRSSSVDLQLKSWRQQRVMGKRPVAALNWLPGCGDHCINDLFRFCMRMRSERPRTRSGIQRVWCMCYWKYCKYHVMPKSNKSLFWCQRSKQ